jgi:acyl-CoA dehydrogenase
MIWLSLIILFSSLTASFYGIKLIIYCLAILTIQILFFGLNYITNYQFYTVFTLSLIFFSILNIKNLRINLFTRKFYKLLSHSDNQWENFKRIDNGWFASDFEKSIFQGRPNFIKINNIQDQNKLISEFESNINEILLNEKKSIAPSTVNKLADLGATSLLISTIYNGQNLTPTQISDLLKNISKINPVLSAIIGLMNLDSLTSIIHQYASLQQKKKFLPLLASAKMIPFLKPTSLYETLDSQKSSIEGRIEKDYVNGKLIVGVRISFQDVILLGTTRSNCFYLNVNIKDFNNFLGDKTNLGTAVCIIDKQIKNISYRKGLKAYDNYLHYYACTGKDVFIPIKSILNENSGIGNGLEYLYKNQYFASSIWPLAISIPTNNTATLTAWYFAHLQKQNGRQLLSFKVVLAKLNEQFSQSLKLKLLNKVSLHNNLNPQLIKFTAILNKNTHITQTMEQLALLRGILGSNSHNIKTESKLRFFYKVAHLTTELDGMSHEINQLPLIKKAALACHPYYHKEVDILNQNNDSSIKEFDKLVFKHVGYILQNITKTWVYTLRTSIIGKLFFPKNKYKIMIKRMSSSFAFLSDITLIVWTFKRKINTSFASHLGECIQHLTTAIALHDYYVSNNTEEHSKDLTKITLKNTLYSCQNSLKDTVNLAFNRASALFVKMIMFPLGRPFHEMKVFKSLGINIEKLCEFDDKPDEKNTSYTPFLQKIYKAKQKLKAAESAEVAVSNVTGTPLTTDNYETLINRCLAAGIVSVEQSEQLRDAYQSILAIQLTNHFGNNYERKI